MHHTESVSNNRQADVPDGLSHLSAAACSSRDKGAQSKVLQDSLCFLHNSREKTYSQVAWPALHAARLLYP